MIANPAPDRTPTDQAMQRVAVRTSDAPAQVWCGGRVVAPDAPPVVLIHGAWGGAEAHWSRVWGALSAHAPVVAPELPVVASPGADDAPRTAEAHAAWLEEVLDALGHRRAWIVGSSMGAGIAWQLAAANPARVCGVALVNGGPAQQLSPGVSALMRRGPLRGLLRAMVRRNAFSAGALRRGFCAPTRAPDEIVSLLRGPARLRRARVELMLDFMLESGLPGAVEVPALVVWGEQDRLVGMELDAARAIARRLQGAQLRTIPGAGHLPQVEQPEAFVETLLGWMQATSAAEISSADAARAVPEIAAARERARSSLRGVLDV